jgi:putative ABC transport system substrate-binding protein
VIIAGNPILLGHRDQIATLALRHRLPSISQYREMAAAGALMSYGPDRSEFLRQAVSYVDRILQGTKPSELPIVQPARLPFIVNLKTAKALGLDISPNVIALTDEVIE